tara:strand:+ start:363 stop:794 length:432 start_codon:yes stop_codon:yes gene_type:complete
MKIAIGCDHAGYDLKEKIKEYLSEKQSFEILDIGTYSVDSVDYPSFGHKVGIEVVEKKVDSGIVICGSGIGISIAANKINGVRAALCTSEGHAEMSRKHNDANILALGSRMTKYEDVIKIVDVWFNTAFEGGRHLDRINKLEI